MATINGMKMVTTAAGHEASDNGGEDVYHYEMEVMGVRQDHGSQW